MSRQLKPGERAVLNLLLAQARADGGVLESQAARVLATGGCECGCGTIDLESPVDVRRSGLPDGPASEADIVVRGEPLGGVLLFVRDGRLDRLEVYSFDAPLPMPVVEHLSFER